MKIKNRKKNSAIESFQVGEADSIPNIDKNKETWSLPLTTCTYYMHGGLYDKYY